jgi:hypothetical protein
MLLASGTPCSKGIYLALKPTRYYIIKKILMILDGYDGKLRKIK